MAVATLTDFRTFTGSRNLLLRVDVSYSWVLTFYPELLAGTAPATGETQFSCGSIVPQQPARLSGLSLQYRCSPGSDFHRPIQSPITLALNRVKMRRPYCMPVCRVPAPAVSKSLASSPCSPKTTTPLNRLCQ